MDLSISNIAWRKEENAHALQLLRKYEIKNVEVAPTLLFDSVENIDTKEIDCKRQEYQKAGFTMVAMQSLLYGTPPYSIFDGDHEKESIFKHLKRICFIAEKLGVNNLIFGSPKNRYIKNIQSDNIKIAKSFFENLCDMASELNLNICLEANPKEYGCNFIINTFEAVDFIKLVNRNNFWLNLDASTTILNGEPLEKVFEYSKPYIQHVHISSPYLRNIADMDHAQIAKLLKIQDYRGFISLEMKADLTENNITNLEENIKILKTYY
jgi:sugar phosphate isomerase/epimerase